MNHISALLVLKSISSCFLTVPLDSSVSFVFYVAYVTLSSVIVFLLCCSLMSCVLCIFVVVLLLHFMLFSFCVLSCQ